MRRSLLDYVACPCCHVPLTVHPHRETPAPDGSGDASPRIVEGLLVCDACGRWYPIAGELPELLPDHLRRRDRDEALFRAYAPGLPEGLRRRCACFVPGAAAGDDPGAHHKAAEIAIRDKIDDPDFFGPGDSAPFNPGNTGFTLYLIHLFGVVAPLLDARAADVVIDSGSGYSWTTEWLYRSGIDAIGVDICRTYLEIGMRRMGASRPHLVVADIEHLPFKSSIARAVLAYESFHHIPDRPRAMAGYARVLAGGGRVVLAEPGAAHETAEGSVDVMQKYGILERGMELDDVAAYAAGTALSAPEQVFLGYARHTDLQRPVVEVARKDSPIDGHLFVLRKGPGAPGAHPEPGTGPPRDVLIAATEAPRLREQLTETARQLHETRVQLAQARDHIFHMERSAFWRLRQAWLRLRGLLPRRSRPDNRPRTHIG